jgi:DNA-binding MltR family transcriptional regulator
MASHGRRKPKLRDYSSITLSTEQKDALRAALMGQDWHPIATAILGAVMLEHEVDLLLRRKFLRRDDSAWETLVSEQGPLRTFSSKIITGFAFKLYDEKVKFDLDVVREIRNAFAHSRKMLNFDDPLIIAKLLSVRTLPPRFARELQRQPTKEAAKATYINLCFELVLRLLKWRTRALTAKNRRMTRKLNKSPSPLAQALAASANPSFNPFFPSLLARRAQTSLLPLDSRSADPKPVTPGALLSGLLRAQPKTDDNKDK